MTATATDFALHPVTPVIGAEVTGIDLRETPDRDTAERIRQALLK